MQSKAGVSDMMVCEAPRDEIERIARENGFRVTSHTVKRLKQRLAPVDMETLERNLITAYGRYKSGKARKKKRVRLTRNGVVTRDEYLVRMSGVTYVFSGDVLISVFI